MRNLLFALLAGLAIAGTVAMVMLLLARAKTTLMAGRSRAGVQRPETELSGNFDGGFPQKNHIAPGLFAGQ